MENELTIEFGKENTFEILVDQKEEIFIDVLIPFQDEEESKPAIIGDDLESSVEKPTILEGKRSRKPTARLDVSVLTPSKKVLSIPQVTIRFDPILEFLVRLGSWRSFGRY